MFCLKCGQQLPDGSAFCSACGTPIIRLNTTTASSAGSASQSAAGTAQSSANKKVPSTDEKNYYEILEITREATTEEIEEAIKKQRTVWSNRVARGGAMGEQARVLVERIGEAEEILLDSAKRQAYDESLTSDVDYQIVVPAGEKNWLTEARSYFDQRDLEMATQAVERAISQQHDDPEVWFIASVIYYATNDYTAATNAAQQALLLNPSSAVMHQHRGDVYLMQDGNEQKAIDMYNKAKRLTNNPDYVKQLDEDIIYAKSRILRNEAAQVYDSLPDEFMYDETMMDVLNNCLEVTKRRHAEGLGYFDEVPNPSSWLISDRTEFDNDFSEHEKEIQNLIDRGNETVHTSGYTIGIIWVVFVALITLMICGSAPSAAGGTFIGGLIIASPGFIAIASGTKKRYELK